MELLFSAVGCRRTVGPSLALRLLLLEDALIPLTKEEDPIVELWLLCDNELGGVMGW